MRTPAEMKALREEIFQVIQAIQYWNKMDIHRLHWLIMRGEYIAAILNEERFRQDLEDTVRLVPSANPGVIFPSKRDPIAVDIRGNILKRGNL